MERTAINIERINYRQFSETLKMGRRSNGAYRMFAYCDTENVSGVKIARKRKEKRGTVDVRG